MTWDTSVDELRVVLSDGPLDKLRFRKKVFGEQNGTNTEFKTFEFRRVTDFSSSSTPPNLGVYLGNTRLASSAIAGDYTSEGMFVLASAPTDDGNALSASYYIQWFTDAELAGFLQRATEWLGIGSDVTMIPFGLKNAALCYATYEAYKKLSIRFAEHITEVYRLEDNPDEQLMKVQESYQNASKDSFKAAEHSRDDFYSRKGKSLAPIFGTVRGRVKDPIPRM